MPNRSGEDHDFATVARSVVERAIGEELERIAVGRPERWEEFGGCPARKAGRGKGWSGVGSGAVSTETIYYCEEGSISAVEKHQRLTDNIHL
jgi:hypothetical protein